jgi:hypothetical protein
MPARSYRYASNRAEAAGLSCAPWLGASFGPAHSAFGGGSVAWTKDNAAVFYTQYPREGERPAEDRNFYMQVYFHKLGSPESEDTYSIGKEFLKIAEVALQSNGASDYIVAIVANGDGGDFAHFVYGPNKSWRQITKFEDQIKTGVLGFGPVFYAISLQDAPHGKVVKFGLDTPNAKPDAVVPAGEGVMESIAVTTDRLVVQTGRWTFRPLFIRPRRFGSEDVGASTNLECFAVSCRRASGVGQCWELYRACQVV